MKKWMTLCFICAAIFVACNKKAAPGAGANGNRSNNSTDAAVTNADVEKNAATEKAAAEAMKAADKKADEPGSNPVIPDFPDKPSDEESGLVVYKAKCTTCHAAKTVNAYTFNQWHGILKSMVPKAKLSSDEENQVVAYIKANAK
jgi:cytochrome c5